MTLATLADFSAVYISTIANALSTEGLGIESLVFNPHHIEGNAATIRAAVFTGAGVKIEHEMMVMMGACDSVAECATSARTSAWVMFSNLRKQARELSGHTPPSGPVRVA